MLGVRPAQGAPGERHRGQLRHRGRQEDVQPQLQRAHGLHRGRQGMHQKLLNFIFSFIALALRKKVSFSTKCHLELCSRILNVPY